MRRVRKKRVMAVLVVMSMVLAGCSGSGASAGGAGNGVPGGESIQSGSDSGNPGGEGSSGSSQTAEAGAAGSGEGERREAGSGAVSSKEELAFPLGQQIQSDSFTGAVYITPMIVKDEVYNFPSTNNLIFEPGARSSWHSHGGMVILGTGGVGYYQEEGKPAQIIREGDVVQCAPGVRHWHGAAPDSWFSQIVIFDSSYVPEGEAEPETPVTEEEYAALETVESRQRTDGEDLSFMFLKAQQPLIADTFSGPAYVSDILDSNNAAGAPGLHYVVFDKGVINNWHTHEGGQILIATDGIGYHQMEGEPVEVLYPGDVAFCPPGVKHWHGGSIDTEFAHIAVNTNPELNGVEWFDRISEEEYEKLSTGGGTGADVQAAAVRGSVVEAGPGIAVADTEAGKVQGYISNGIYTYHGIPYAQADERFVEAGEVEPWEGVRMAMNYGAISPQAAVGSIAGGDNMDNNCQNLNVWTPGLDDGKKRPVMVWLHGGGFSTGSSIESAAYDGENLSKKGDVVVVSVNHRLNVLGHLNLAQYGEKYKNSGNVGITDIIDALRWVQDNISRFGGDPENVTVFGESGGGAKVLALMTSPEAKGLFHKGIVESGATETMGVIFMTEEASERVTELTLEKLGIAPDRIEELQTISYEELTRASDEALIETGEEMKIPAALGSGYSLSWEPVVDGEFLPTDPVTEDSFAEAGKDIPLLIGSNLNEWETMELIMNQAQAQYDNKNTWTEEETRARLEEKYGDQTDEIVDAFLKAYPHRTAADALYVDSRVIRLPMLKIMSHKADQGGAPVYAYMFNWESPVMAGTNMAFHTAEIPFVFHNIDKEAMRIGGGEEARRIEDAMSQAWINFARTGDPSTDTMEWPAYTREGGATMIFDTVQEVVYGHDRELMSLLAPDYEY